jgi:hypothetical protein
VLEDDFEVVASVTIKSYRSVAARESADGQRSTFFTRSSSRLAATVGLEATRDISAREIP